MKLTISEAAAHCGYKSRTVIYRLQRDGLLRDYEVGRDGRSLLLESNPPGRCALRDHIAACVQLRHDSPLAQRERHRPVAEPLDGLTDAELDAYCDEHLSDAVLAAALEQTPDWECIAEHGNSFLGAEWPAPPWSPDQWATVAMALALAQDEASDG
jgi:hypothetical protein